MAEQARQTGDLDVAATAITLAAFANTALNCSIVLTLGAGPLRKRILFATALLLAGGGLALVMR